MRALTLSKMQHCSKDAIDRRFAAGFLLLLCLLQASTASATLRISAGNSGAKEWKVVNSLTTTAAHSPGAWLTINLGSHAPFTRESPKTMDPQVLEDFRESFNLLQNVPTSAETSDIFMSDSSQFVAVIPEAYVEGEAGLVYDSLGHVFHETDMFPSESTGFVNPMPSRPVEASSASFGENCVRHPHLATSIQKHGHMYFHFLAETIPKLALLQKVMPPDTKVLMWGEPYEADFLKLMGISPTQVVKFNASQTYCADVLYFPTPVRQLTPPLEALQSVREALHVEEVPPQKRDLIVYVSREDAEERRVHREEELLHAIRNTLVATGSELQLVKFLPSGSAKETIDVFSRAQVVVGPHGAGLGNMVFCAPGTSVLEFQLLRGPALAYWHIAEALDLDYWMITAPHSHWLEPELHVPINEVEDVLSAILDKTEDAAPPSCPPGGYLMLETHDVGRSGAAESALLLPTHRRIIQSGAIETGEASMDGEIKDARDAARGSCQPCPPGTYSFLPGDKPTCRPCAKGRYASTPGSRACRTCPLGTFSLGGAASCTACPHGSASPLPGAYDAAQCTTDEEHRAKMSSIAPMIKKLRKLSPTWRDNTRGRTLIEDDGSQEDLYCMDVTNPMFQALYNRWPDTSPQLLPCSDTRLVFSSAEDNTGRATGRGEEEAGAGDERTVPMKEDEVDERVPSPIEKIIKESQIDEEEEVEGEGEVEGEVEAVKSSTDDKTVAESSKVREKDEKGEEGEIEVVEYEHEENVDELMPVQIGEVNAAARANEQSKEEDEGMEHRERKEDEEREETEEREEKDEEEQEVDADSEEEEITGNTHENTAKEESPGGTGGSVGEGATAGSELAEVLTSALKEQSQREEVGDEGAVGGNGNASSRVWEVVGPVEGGLEEIVAELEGVATDLAQTAGRSREEASRGPPVEHVFPDGEEIIIRAMGGPPDDGSFIGFDVDRAREVADDKSNAEAEPEVSPPVSEGGLNTKVIIEGAGGEEVEIDEIVSAKGGSSNGTMVVRVRPGRPSVDKASTIAAPQSNTMQQSTEPSADVGSVEDATSAPTNDDPRQARRHDSADTMEWTSGEGGDNPDSDSSDATPIAAWAVSAAAVALTTAAAVVLAV